MAKTDIKVRNLKAESKGSFLSNVTVVIACTLVLWLVLPCSDVVGERNMLFMNALFGGLSICFMTALEKYSVIVSGMNERIVINILSSLYTLVIFCLVNLVMFMSHERLVADLLMALAEIVLISIGDYLFDKAMKNPKKYRAPKLLFINNSDKTFLRMKRMKYGVLSTYDSWYESIEGMNVNEFQDFAEKKFPEFDAVCILDGLTEEEYNLAVKLAVRLQKDLFIVPNMIDVGKTNAKLVRFDDVLTLYMPKHFISKADFVAKRIMDIAVSLIAFLVAAIPMAIIALLIKITSPGPVFYKQERMTRDKKRFMIYKFRTMVPDAEKLTGPKFAEKDDPRITPIGKILRSCRLDELPQILNILKGDMSLVGPRPERPVFIEQFEKEIENYDYRFAVKAGLTSLSHVYGRYSTYIHDRTYYDLFYITNYSFLMDIKIILLTTKTMFMKSAAEGEDDFKQKTTIAQKEEVLK